jgi:hypothetical protein
MGPDPQFDPQQMDESSATPSQGADAMLSAPPDPAQGHMDPTLVCSIIGARRLRDHFFRADLFADPAWDMLLDLYAARLEGVQVAVASLCIAAAVAPTTALRWIKALCDQGLFVRVADPEDGRRVFIELSDHAASALGAYLTALGRISENADLAIGPASDGEAGARA